MGGFSVVILMGLFFMAGLFLVAFLAAVVIYTVISYVFDGISFMCMGKSLGYKNVFTAWIPFYNKYLLGKISGDPVFGAASCVLSLVPVIMGLVFYFYAEAGIVLLVVSAVSLIVVFICDTFMCQKIYRSRAEKYGDLLMIFHAITLGLLRPIFLFALRNKPIKENAK